MSGKDSAWNEKKLPKNIRQVGETDGQNRIYLEDYVYTYVRKALEKRNAQVVCGFLIGTWEDREQGRYYFVKSAMIADGLLSAKESVIKGTPLWKKNRELAEYYFPGQQLVGWFMHCREEGFYEEAELQKMHWNIFPEGEALFYLQQEEEHLLFFGTEDGIEKISGYYIYFEKNEDMQSYMLDTGQPASEEIRTQDAAIEKYRNIMQEKKNQKGRKQEVVLRRICVGLSAAVLFLSAYTWYGQYQLKQKKQTIVQQAESHGYIEAGATAAAETDARLQAQETGRSETEPSGEAEETASFSDGELQESSSDQEPVSSVGESSIGESESTAEEAAAGINSPSGHYYEVHNGDTLVGICLSLYGTTDVLPAICELNHIDNPALIYNGQRIYLP